jgi:ribosomal protein S18 acetylase RimI-like enzyme
VNVEIRPFEMTDQEGMRTLVLAGLAEHWGHLDETRNPDLRDIQRSYVDEGHAVLVAVLDGQIVGSGVLMRESEVTGRIVRMSVALALRRHGIAREMVVRLLEVARARGFREVLIETTHDWHPAIKLYERCGFVLYDRDQESAYLRLDL